MAASFSHQHHYIPAAPFVFGYEGTDDIIASQTSFSAFFPERHDHQKSIPLHDHDDDDNHEIHKSTLNTNTRPPLHKSCTVHTTTHHDSPASSTMAVELGSGGRGDPVAGKKRKNYNDIVTNMGERESRRKRHSRKQKKVAMEVPTGYVHVRARRGQATDSHSLAERVRRQKISVRMKLLQSLVPGCDRITGKALILDEIIGYVKTLQTQVQFLAAKLSSVNSIFNDLEMDYYNTNPPAPQEAPLPKTCMLDFQQLPVPVLESSSTDQLQLRHQEESSNVPFQNDCNLLWDTDDGQRQELVTQHGLDNLYPF